jgi:thiol-disulfide isomerase/thioredoxin
MKLVMSMFVIFMTVYVVTSADAVIEDEDENTNP